MKKYLFLALSAIAAVAFTSCGDPDNGKNKPNPETDVVITVSPATLTMSPGDSERLKATVEPAGTSVTLKWESSDPAVATVSAAGLVTAVAEGEATITASAEGAKAGTCTVNVTGSAVYDMFNIVDYSLFGNWTPVEGTDTVITLSDGDYNVSLQTISYVLMWDGDILYAGSGFAGAGNIIELDDVPFYVIKDGAYAGYYIGGGGVAVADTKGVLTKYTAQPGKLDVQKYGTFMKSYIDAVQDENATAEDIDWDALYEGLTGSTIYYVDADNQIWYCDYGRYSGYIDQLLVLDEEEGVSYDVKLHWFDYTSDDRYFGIKIAYNEDSTVVSVVEPYDVLTIEREFTNVEEAAAAPQYRLGDMSRYHKEIPSIITNRTFAPIDKFVKK